MSLRFSRAAEIFILPSLWEGLPNVVLEAMAAGVPVVATRVEGIGDLLIDDRTGLVVPPESSGAISEAISRLLLDPEHAHRLVHNGQVFVRDNFAWTTIVETYEKALRRITRSACSGGPAPLFSPSSSHSPENVGKS